MRASLLFTAFLVTLFLTTCVSGSDNLATIGQETPTPIVVSTEGPEEPLKLFMLARIRREDQVVRELVSDVLRSSIMTGATYGIVFQASNPCWFRYEVMALDRPTATTAAARVRVYQHFWGGDNAGGPPTSWEQEVGLVMTVAGWRVDYLSPFQNLRQELAEPHGSTTSACNVTRQRGN